MLRKKKEEEEIKMFEKRINKEKKLVLDMKHGKERLELRYV